MIDAEILVETKYWEKIIKNPKKKILSLLNKFPNQYKFNKKKVSISVLLTNNKKVKILNKNFRKKNKPTDILSFPNFNKIDFKKNIKKNNIYLGDIAISYQEFFKNNKNDLENGFIKIFIHGYLHLLNFNHKSNKDYAMMSSVENKLFQIVKGKIDNKKI